MDVKCTIVCAATSGESDLLAKFIAAGIPEIEKIIGEYSKTMPPVRLQADIG